MMENHKENLLDLIDITVSFEGFLALNNLKLSLKKGELRAVIGPNGAGKTTFLDVITGKVKPTNGQVIFKGISLIGRKEHKIARLGVGRKFQSPRVFENLSVFWTYGRHRNFSQKNTVATAFPKIIEKCIF